MAKNTRVVNSAHARTLRKSFRINPVAKAQAIARRKAGAYRDRKKYDRKRDKQNAQKDHHVSQASKGKSDTD